MQEVIVSDILYSVITSIVIFLCFVDYWSLVSIYLVLRRFLQWISPK